MATLNDQPVRELLEQPNCAVISTLNADGSILATVAWIGAAGSEMATVAPRAPAGLVARLGAPLGARLVADPVAVPARFELALDPVELRRRPVQLPAIAQERDQHDQPNPDRPELSVRAGA